MPYQQTSHVRPHFADMVLARNEPRFLSKAHRVIHWTVKRKYTSQDLLWVLMDPRADKVLLWRALLVQARPFTAPVVAVITQISFGRNDLIAPYFRHEKLVQHMNVT
jgi:hypothetical protein